MSRPWLCEGCKKWLDIRTSRPVVEVFACLWYGNIGKPPRDQMVGKIRYCGDCSK